MPSRPATNPLDALRAPFPAEALGHLPRLTCKACRESQRKRCDEHQWVARCPTCNTSHSTAAMHITYVGHADVTARLLEVDPEWTWRPFTTDELAAVPNAFRDGLWIMLTIGGVTRPGFGNAENGKGAKEAIGDALRNAAMRFGVALDLWAKGDREWANAPRTDATGDSPDAAPPTEDVPEWTGPTTTELLARVDALAAEMGVTYEQATAKWRQNMGGLTVDDLDSQPPRNVQALVDWLTGYRDQRKADQPATGDGS